MFDAGEGALRFTFHTPFTTSGKVHGSTAEQCKKLTELEVRGRHLALISRSINCFVPYSLRVSF